MISAFVGSHGKMLIHPSTSPVTTNRPNRSSLTLEDVEGGTGDSCSVLPSTEGDLAAETEWLVEVIGADASRNASIFVNPNPRGLVNRKVLTNSIPSDLMAKS